MTTALPIRATSFLNRSKLKHYGKHVGRFTAFLLVMLTGIYTVTLPWSDLPDWALKIGTPILPSSLFAGVLTENPILGGAISFLPLILVVALATFLFWNDWRRHLSFAVGAGLCYGLAVRFFLLFIDFA
ncbi:hypothetical protein LF1_55420 [Rubripirellula obstinata]|uniref:Uncharacterized protein n=1 Tax=Rubripirellula obstinata TaxID=406547 RepID=A0A5B1CA39_9BACT|nr:hypothetical protein [Rubripirellula obstinata]KAA1257142.1 hypothetical protein LF1_55420 [Rubripirellula obstinata]